jgi:hypothetical protein
MPLTKIQSLGITDGTIVNADINASAAIAGTKISGSFGKVLQVVSTTKTDTFNVTSATYADITGFSVSITPSSASNKILVLVNINAVTASDQGFWRLVRDSTAISVGTSVSSRIASSGGNLYSGVTENIISNSLNFFDSPNTTSSTTYKVQVYGKTGVAYVNRPTLDTDNSNFNRSASTITVMEIAV